MSKRRSRASLLKKIEVSWQKAFLQLIPFGGFSSHNEIEIFHDGDQAFAAIHHAFVGAKRSIFLETYILAEDKLAVWLRDALIEAQKRGAAVTVLYDHLGSAGLSNSFLQPMRAAGIKVLGFNPIWPWRRRGPLLFRDHRKIIVVDESWAFCGGMNITADYAGPRYGNDRYRDTLARIKGPAVMDLLAITKESIVESEFTQKPQHLVKTLKIKMNNAAATRLFFKKLQPRKEGFKFKADQGTLIQVLRSNKRRNLTHIQRSMEESVKRAVDYCYFTTPYFLPSQGLLRALVRAKQRGVDVRILSAGISDVPLMRFAARHVYSGLIKENIRVYEMNKKTLHAKVATIDGIYASIGSYNLDHWSARRNLEVNLLIIDHGIADQLKEQFLFDLKSSQEIDNQQFLKRSLFQRFLCWLAYLLLKL